MAEIVVKIQDQGLTDDQYKDGDILAAFTDRAIGLVHAQNLCGCKNFGFNSEGLRSRGTLAEKLLFRTRQYVFQRLSTTEVKRIDLVTMAEDVFSNTPDESGQYIDVRLYLSRRLKLPEHLIFGSLGAEIWYGGKSRHSDEDVSRIWTEIENHSADRRVDYSLWPAGKQDIKSHLIVRTTDFSDLEHKAFVSPRYKLDDDGVVELDDNNEKIIVAARNIHTNWRALLSDVGVTESKVLDRNYAVGKTVELVNKPIRFASKDQAIQSDRTRLGNKTEGRLPS